MSKDDLQGAPSGTGSRPSDHAAKRHGRAGFDPSREHVRHIRRGSTYAVLNRTGLLQTDQPLVDGDVLVTYQGSDGQWWHQPLHEFNLQGRFEPVPAPAIEARRAETQGGSVEDKSAVREAEAPDSIDKLKRENAELREALSWIADQEPATQEMTHLHEVCQFARTLLSQSPEGGEPK